MCALCDTCETAHGGYSGFVSRLCARLLRLALGDFVDFGLLGLRLWCWTRLLSLFGFRFGVGALLITRGGIWFPSFVGFRTCLGPGSHSSFLRRGGRFIASFLCLELTNAE